MQKGKVSVVVLTRGETALLETCLAGLYPALEGMESEVIVVEHATELAGKYLEQAFPFSRQKDTIGPHYLHVADEPVQSFSTLNNAGVARATGEYVLLLNNDVILRADTVKAMKDVLEEQPQVGIVGAKLLFPDETIQHIGVTFTREGIPLHIGYKKPDDGTFLPATRSDYFDAVTFACAMIRREVWDLVGGLDTAYHFNYEDVDFCLKVRELGLKCYVTVDAVAIHMEGQAKDFRKSKEHSMLRNVAILKEKWIDTLRMEKILGHKLPTYLRPGQIERTAVVFVPADENSGISIWRMVQPLRRLSESGLVHVEMIPNIGADVDHAMRAFDRADVVVFQAHISEGVKRFAAMKKLRPWAMLYEYDDNPLYLSPYASVYQGLGTQEHRIRTENGEEVWLWRDGENGFDLRRNRASRQRQMEIIALCDGMTTTTDPLVKFFGRYNQHVWQLPNCIDFDVYGCLDGLYDPRPGKPFRIGWWGGDNHWHDVSTIGKPMVAFVNSHEDVRMVFLGAFYRGPFKGIDMSRVIEGDWVHAEAWPYRLANAGIDLAVIPLADPAIPHMRFNHFKSDIKWLEASALKIPSLVQEGREAYNNCVDRVNCLTYDGEEEFLEKLEELHRSPDLRKKLGQAAYDWTREYRDLQKEIHRWAEVYEEAAKMDRGVPEEPETGTEALSNAVAEGS